MKKNKPDEVRSPLEISKGVVKFFRVYWQALTAFFMLWFSLLLMYGVTADAMNEFYRFIFFLRHPLVLVINGLSLLVMLMHAFFWFGSYDQPKQRRGATKMEGLFGVLVALLLMGLLLWALVR